MQQASSRPFTGLAILLGLPHTASWTGGEQRETFHSVYTVFNKAVLHCFTSKPFGDFVLHFILLWQGSELNSFYAPQVLWST